MGVTLIVVSFSYWFFPGSPHLLFFNALFYIGNIMFFDFLSQYYAGFSLLQTPDRRKQFLILGAVYGIILELSAHWLGKLWYYPHWDTFYYWVILVPEFAVYTFYLLETFLGTKAVLEHWFLNRRPRVSFKGLRGTFEIIGLIGATGVAAVTTAFFLAVPKFANSSDFFSINRPVSLEFNVFVYLALGSVFFWLFLEYVEFKRHETSLLYEVIKGNPYPLLSVFVAAWISGIIYEVFNLPGGLWRYANWPLTGAQLLGVPIIIILAWPLHYLPAFCLYRILFKKETERLWE